MVMALYGYMPPYVTIRDDIWSLGWFEGVDFSFEARYCWYMNNTLPQNRRTYWRRMILRSTSGLGKMPELLEEAISLCVESEEAGRPVGAWHAAATVTGKKCWCAECSPNLTFARR